MTNAIPTFSSHPDEKSDFVPAVKGWLRSIKTQPLYVDGVFDILISQTKDEIDKYLELKVCLASAPTIPISSKQWSLIDSTTPDFDRKARILIYRHEDQHFAVCRFSTLAGHITGQGDPVSTSYVSRPFLRDSIPWQLPPACFSQLRKWIHGV